MGDDSENHLDDGEEYRSQVERDLAESQEMVPPEARADFSYLERTQEVRPQSPESQIGKWVDEHPEEFNDILTPPIPNLEKMELQVPMPDPKGGPTGYADGVVYEDKYIPEIKPDTPGWVEKGLAQGQTYVDRMEKNTETDGWTTGVHTWNLDRTLEEKPWTEAAYFQTEVDGPPETADQSEWNEPEPIQETAAPDSAFEAAESDSLAPEAFETDGPEQTPDVQEQAAPAAETEAPEPYFFEEPLETPEPVEVDAPDAAAPEVTEADVASTDVAPPDSSMVAPAGPDSFVSADSGVSTTESVSADSGVGFADAGTGADAGFADAGSADSGASASSSDGGGVGGADGGGTSGF